MRLSALALLILVRRTLDYLIRINRKRKLVRPWHPSLWLAMKALASLCKCTNSPELFQLAHTKHGIQRTVNVAPPLLPSFVK